MNTAFPDPSGWGHAALINTGRPLGRASRKRNQASRFPHADDEIGESLNHTSNGSPVAPTNIGLALGQPLSTIKRTGPVATRRPRDQALKKVAAGGLDPIPPPLRLLRVAPWR